MSSGYSSIDALTRKIDNYSLRLRIKEQGTVTAAGDGVIWVSGLPSAGMEELLITSDGSLALVYLLSPERVGAVLLRSTGRLKAGVSVEIARDRLTIKAGDAFLGRVVDPLGLPLDGLEAPEGRFERMLEHSSPPITSRDFVHKPLYTGSKIVDSMIPLGHGQRQLLIGDNGTGKTTFAVDTILNQRDKGTLCVYVLIGQKRSTIASLIQTLKEYDALSYTTVVVAEASAPPGLQYLAPYAGCALAESWMESGRPVLIVYDDLSTHARIYRELSLLLRRSPGREAYPGDVFYLHSRLLERSTCLSPKLGGGSMTALAIVETQQDDISAYIPTNLISITDGQIYFDHRLFASGNLPAIDVRRSVSRIGGAAQHPAIKKEAGRLKLDYLQFLELEVFSHFGARLQATVKERLARGTTLRLLLQQEVRSPMSPEAQLAWMIAFSEGYFIGSSREVVAKDLDLLAEHVARASLSLDDGRNEWLALIRSALGEPA
jgi:F-type H+-transporting ATPase subunit alpha